jgi:hypothetical protein
MEPTKHYGYYVFLGLGDFAPPPTLSPEWTSTWDLQAWKRRIDELMLLGTNTLFIYLMGHQLPYPSTKFPEYVEKNHPNVVKEEFFQTVLDWCIERGIYLVAVFSTTGHAKAYTAAHPELAICSREGEPQVDSGIVCHHKEGATRYAVGVIEECLIRYRGFAGVIFHPPEFGTPCFCPSCQEKYLALYGKSLLAATDQEAKRFFMTSNLYFQRTVLESVVRRHVPGARLLTFSIPWIFEAEFEQIAREIEQDTIIVDWDYNLSDDRLSLLQLRLQRYQRFGHKVWFMPTSGYAFSEARSTEEQAEGVLRQIELAIEVGVKDIIYFMGPRWWPTVAQTSWYLRRNWH